ncbi:MULTISPECIES: TnsA endonuclease N-terminal domain-containing protein [Stenotrophomonas]|uniref:TnsA endonuclease N-terminal domain-containing protein n=1 Tax=Stenotrophomonas TaxID=40323 RepID=UPI001CF13CDF|nr:MULTISPECIES: TnsA endonuclease N-terminal domain-containing protein [Stenotrophomonas]MCA7024944.1 DEAD/DEAH box helicase family protein [Stenotrophomonas acidaminiphila]MCE4074623.1 DEAD/DEAH box helicase family protein [Stenotrophomonas acidaminiphila]
MAKGTRKAKETTTSVTASLDFAFFRFLWQFYQSNKGKVRQSYRELTRKFLDFNDPERNPKAFLRQPQFEALETYVFLKEFLGNAKVEEVFKAWYERSGKFEGRQFGSFRGTAGQEMFQFGDSDELELTSYKALFDRMRRNSRMYPNYIFALTMGTGKTILMATCIFYEFLLANKFPKAAEFCHNALVFAPDKTVLQSLKEIEGFDLALVVPPEYVAWMATNLHFHYLEESGTSLDTMDRSKFNVIVSNTQKIILKRQHKDKNATDKLFGATAEVLTPSSVYDENADLYGFDQPEDEADLTTNQRFEKLRRLEQLGIYVDEAHHAFGKTLAKDMGIGQKENDTSLRTTIDVLAKSLKDAGTHVVACFNYTGTPYVGRDVLPEVVYAYGLSESIEKGFLKKVVLHGYTNTRTSEFVDIAIESFLTETRGLRPEGMLPKIAFFAATVDELTQELRPAVEDSLRRYGIPASRILVNVGDDKVTLNDDIREFNRLDTTDSEKQFILLVNKGREGWNCRSLFSVGLFREPRSKIFILQASMRCLRAIGEAQHTGHVYLSDDNLKILNDELQQNFRITAEELQKKGKDKEAIQVHVVPPPVKIKLVRVRKLHSIRELEVKPGQPLGLDRSDKDAWGSLIEKYRLIETQQEGLTADDAARVKDSRTFDLTDRRVKRAFSRLTLVAEVSRYLNRSPLEIEEILDSTQEGTDELVAMTNEFNELLYDEIIPRLFRLLYELDPSEEKEEHEVELIKIPDKGYYEVSAAKDKIARRDDASLSDEERTKSFHLDAYCFDSGSERQLFWDLLREKKVRKLYFTGMLTHGQSEFFVQYIDPESRTVRSYYPDFVLQREEPDGSLKYVIVEVKADNQIEDAVVQAKKDFASQMAVASGMEYRILPSSQADSREYRVLL